jgi:hypothetical protein
LVDQQVVVSGVRALIGWRQLQAFHAEFDGEGFIDRGAVFGRNDDTLAFGALAVPSAAVANIEAPINRPAIAARDIRFSFSSPVFPGNLSGYDNFAAIAVQGTRQP